MEYHSDIKQREVLEPAGKHHAQQKKPDTQDHVLHDSTSIKCAEQANPLTRKADGWLPGLVGRRVRNDCYWVMGLLLGDGENILELDRGDGCTTL